MGTYSYICVACGSKDDRTTPMINRNNQRCFNCNALMERDYSNVNLCIDVTLGYYDHQLGTYIGSSSDRRIAEERLGVVDMSVDESMKYAAIKKKEKRDNSSKTRKKELMRASNYLTHNRHVCDKISAEIKTTGESATAKKISASVLK